ncbi:hypothetical protein ACO0LG_04660 [Undibacterium sp. Ji42W]|uniref:hypothetical protein n=1 Tax=Undibacterium sp. Ji42W TaxID=3413039 RepID=UPI003BF26CB5
MADRLVIAVLGNRNSGKSTTWNTLFNATVKTGDYERPLYLNDAESVNVFLISGSPEERDIEVNKLLPDPLPKIVLCSTQYRADVQDTYNFFFRNGYEVIVQWLNPGYRDRDSYEDNLALQAFLLSKGATLQVRDATINPTLRVKELRQFILGWAKYRNLVRTKWPN